MSREAISTLDLPAVCSAISQNSAAVDQNYEFPRGSIDALAKAGLLGLLVPKRFGGMEADAMTFAETVQMIGAACASTGMIFVMHSCAVEVMAKHWSNADDVLKGAASGKHLSTLACSERGTGANFYASFSSSEQQGDEFVLNADKCFVTSGGHADSYIVSTQAVGTEDAVNTSLYVVQKGDKDATFEGQWRGLGLRGNSSVALKLNGCRLKKERLVGKQGQGLEIEMGTILPRFLLGTSAVYNGIAEAALNATVAHAKGRKLAHTGDALSMLPVLRSKIATMRIALDASVAFMNVAAEALQRGDSNALILLLQAKQLACRTSTEVTGMAMECCGGIAFSGALSVDRHFRDAQAGLVMAPSNDILLDLVGRASLDLPLM
jgi:alkylation response protein AidB-like acyl-CoA dehydrogenase